MPAGRLPIQVIARSANVGFCAGNNIGAACARGRLLAFAQYDGEVEPNWDEPLRAALERPGVAAAGGVVLKASRGGLIDSAGMAIAPNFAGWSLCENETIPQAGLVVGEDREVVGVSPALLMIRRSDHDRAGGFWEELWMYGDEADYAVRVRRLGRVLVCPGSRMRHLVGAAAGPHQSGLRLYRSSRNRLLGAARHLPAVALARAVVLGAAFDLLQALQQRRREASGAIVRGWIDGLRGMRRARRLGTPAERAQAARLLSPLREALAQQRSLGRATLRGSARPRPEGRRLRRRSRPGARGTGR